MGEVFSRSEGFTSFGTQMWGYIAFHLVTMGLGLLFIDRATKARRESRINDS
jgi:F0F1-type ATP synthase assembly protein I